MIKKEVHKFRWDSLTEIAGAFAELSSAHTIKESVEAFAELSRVAIPESLRLTPKEKAEIPIEDLIEYMPEIMEVNKGFFSVLLAKTTQVLESLPMLVQSATPTSSSQEKESAPKN